LAERRQRESAEAYAAALDACRSEVQTLEAQQRVMEIRLTAKRREIADFERLVTCLCGHPFATHTKLDGCMVSLSDDMSAPGTDCGDCPCAAFSAIS
jgi:hypothetical protein